MPGVTYTPQYRTTPYWAQDGIGGDTLVPGGARLDPAQFARLDAVTVTVGANAAQNATSVTVTALPGALPAGAVLSFGGTKVATLTAAAAAGATTLAVAALPTALATNDAATYAGTGTRFVPGGTPVGRTYAERDAGTAYGPAATTDDEFYLLAEDAIDLDRTPEVHLYRHARMVRENALPGWDAMSSAMKAKIRSLYQCFAAN